VTFAGLPPPIREYPFAHPRRYRSDFAWPDARLLVEIEGGTFGQGRHTRGSGYAEDCRKYNLATMLGWSVLRFTGEMVRDGSALTTTEQFLFGILSNERQTQCEERSIPMG
jgi:very-short-patch-repair endonuclease